MSESTKSNDRRTKTPDPCVGTTVAGRYQIERVIARGGMAVVYLAKHIQLQRKIALKILRPPADAEDPESFEHRFKLEAQTLAQLDHPNIVTLHDYGETDDGRFYLAMEYVGGPRISQILRKGPMTPQRVLTLTEQICEAIAYSHRKNIVHRDLKPSNLLIRTNEDGTEQVKVVDFGLVKLLSTDQSITRAGLIVGSPHCMAPEQVRGQDVDTRTDIYAIGVMLFRGVTGQYPIHGSNPSATMIAHINDTVPPMATVMPDLCLPQGFERMVRRCLEKDPTKRYESAEALLADIQLCLAIDEADYISVSEFDTTIQTQSLTIPRGRNGMPMALMLSFLTAGFTLFVVLGIALWWWVPRTSVVESTPSVSDTIEQSTSTPTATPQEEPSQSAVQKQDASGQTTGKRHPAQDVIVESASTRTDKMETNPQKKPSKESVQSTKSMDAEREESPKTGAKTGTNAGEKVEDKSDEMPEGYLGVPDFD